MTTDEMKKELAKSSMNICAYIQLIFTLLFISSPFILIWNTWDLAWKLGLTGIIGFIITGIIYLIIKKVISISVDSFLKEEESKNVTKSRFLTKLENLRNKKYHKL